MPLYFDQFEQGSPAIDWPMLLVGWRGFNSHKLSAEQVIDFALEQIGKGTPEQDEIAALLANTDPSEWQTIDRYLQQLAETEQFDWALALRKWRLMELKRLLQAFPLLDRTYEYPEDEPFSVYCDLTDFWRDYSELSDSKTIQPQRVTTVEEMLSEQQAWAEQEQVFLRSNTEANR